ncbi:MAG: DUF2510 domain-containing protein [Ilumatobacteraceae bacterium]
MTDGQPPAGWFPDPLGRYDHRWFNGGAWTADVSTDGRRLVDPLGTDPGRASDQHATAALVCGIIGVAIAWIPLAVLLGTILGVVAVVSGARSRRSARRSGRPHGTATAGTVLGAAALSVSVVGWVLTVGLFREVIAFVEPGPRLVDDVTCVVDDTTANVTGTITNLDDDTRSYTMFATIDDADRAGVTRYAEVDDLAAGRDAAWVIRLDGVELPDGPCEVTIVVNGPFPWGIETDPYVE